MAAGRRQGGRHPGREGRRQVALLSRLQPYLVEIRITQAAKQPRCRGLGDIGHGRQLGSRVGQQVVSAIQQQGSQFALAGGKLLQTLVDCQCQTGGHGRSLKLKFHDIMNS